MEYTVEVYKRDARTKEGRRLVDKVDVQSTSLGVLANTAAQKYPGDKGYVVEIHETYVTKTNLMGGGTFTERYDTPYYCSPASEAYWSM
mgnify:CR=1 FL=1